MGSIAASYIDRHNVEYLRGVKYYRLYLTFYNVMWFDLILCDVMYIMGAYDGCVVRTQHDDVILLCPTNSPDDFFFIS